MAQLGKNLLANAKDTRAWGLIPWSGTPVFLPGESHGQKSLSGYITWDHKEMDTSEGAYMRALYKHFTGTFLMLREYNCCLLLSSF